jgi:hypothetical protein
MRRELSIPSLPSSSVAATSSNSFVSFTTSIPFTSSHLQSQLHNGNSPTPLPSIPYALFSSRRRVYPLLPFWVSPHPNSSKISPFIFLHFQAPILQPICFQFYPGMGGGVPPLVGCPQIRSERSGVWTFRRFDVPTLPTPVPNRTDGQPSPHVHIPYAMLASPRRSS